jgi:hypothetical protein
MKNFFLASISHSQDKESLAHQNEIKGDGRKMSRQITLMNEEETAALIETIDDLRDTLLRRVDRKTVVLPDQDELSQLVDWAPDEDLY